MFKHYKCLNEIRLELLPLDKNLLNKRYVNGMLQSIQRRDDMRSQVYKSDAVKAFLFSLSPNKWAQL